MPSPAVRKSERRAFARLMETLEVSGPKRYAALVRASKREILMRALGRHDWNRTHTAAWLGIQRSELSRLITVLGLSIPQPARPPMRRDGHGFFKERV